MRADERVVDSEGDTVGFMVNGVFVSLIKVKVMIRRGEIENLILVKDGTVRAKRALPKVTRA